MPEDVVPPEFYTFQPDVADQDDRDLGPEAETLLGFFRKAYKHYGVPPCVSNLELWSYTGVCPECMAVGIAELEALGLVAIYGTFGSKDIPGQGHPNS